MPERKSEIAAADGKMPKFPADAAVTMAYVPFQNMTTTYDADKGLMVGTLFPDLDKPFLGRMGLK